MRNWFKKERNCVYMKDPPIQSPKPETSLTSNRPPGNEKDGNGLTFVVVSALVCRRPERVFKRSESHCISEERGDPDPPLLRTVTVTVRLVVVTGPSLKKIIKEFPLI